MVADNYAVVPCAKICCDLMVRNLIKANAFGSKQKFVSEMDSWHISIFMCFCGIHVYILIWFSTSRIEKNGCHFVEVIFNCLL